VAASATATTLTTQPEKPRHARIESVPIPMNGTTHLPIADPGRPPSAPYGMETAMAKADRHNMGPGSQGKGSGSGAMTDLPDGMLEENMVLSNRDKSRHSDERGLDSKTVQTEQYQDHAANREVEPE
jgi:hypothetical protein